MKPDSAKPRRTVVAGRTRLGEVESVTLPAAGSPPVCVSLFETGMASVRELKHVVIPLRERQVGREAGPARTVMH